MEVGTIARITYGHRSIELSDGGEAQLGRGTSSDIVVGAADGGPEDLGVSRTAASVTVRDGRVWIRNESASQPLYLVPETGSTRVLEAQAEVVSLPAHHVTIQFRGRIRTHEVQVDLEPDANTSAPTTARERADGAATQYLLDFTPAERRILTALCEPLLVGRGDRARPASYAQAAGRAFLSRSRVENCAADLVRKFASAGVPNLEGPEAKDQLCRYAVRSGSITAADLHLLDR